MEAFKGKPNRLHGGAATILHLPLDSSRELASFKVEVGLYGAAGCDAGQALMKRASRRRVMARKVQADDHSRDMVPHPDITRRGVAMPVNYSASQAHFLWSSMNARGIYTNQLNPSYEVLGSLLLQVPTATDSKTGMTYLAEAQAILPGINLPYRNFGGAQGTIQAMLRPFPQYSGVADTWGDVSNANYNSWR